MNATTARICSLLKDAALAGGRAFDETKVYDAYRIALKWLREHRHIHERGEGDCCKKCGLDLRNEIHLRANEMFNGIAAHGP